MVCFGPHAGSVFSSHFAQNMSTVPPLERLLRIDLVGVDGEGLNLKVPDSFLGRELHILVSRRLPSKPGAVRILQHKESIIEFNMTLQEQGLLTDTCLSFVYIPANVYNVWKVLAGMPFEGREQEFALDTIRQLVGITRMSQLKDLSSLEDLTFSQEYNDDLGVMLPESLKNLTFGCHFNRSFKKYHWNMTGLESITLGADFNQSLDGVQLPHSLVSLTFGRDFNQCLDNTFLPLNLRSLTFGHSFDRSMERVSLPSSLQSLTFGHNFNQTLEHVNLPRRLQDLTFGHGFNQSLENLDVPRLKMLSLGYGFKQSLEPLNLLCLETLNLGSDNWTECLCFPDSLKSLTLGYDFNLCGMKLPQALQSLSLGNNFNMSLEHVDFPPDLQNLTFGHDFNQRIDHLPENLLTLTFGAKFNQRFSDELCISFHDFLQKSSCALILFPHCHSQILFVRDRHQCVAWAYFAC